MTQDRFNKLTVALLLLIVFTFGGCEDLVSHDTSSLLIPEFKRSEVLGFVAGFGTTFAAVPILMVRSPRYW
jgi:MtN3 and saliva related transmembrane protein